MINVALHNIQENGEIDRILAGYKGAGAEIFQSVAQRYKK
jgi:ABC-type amino acid transport substrate-binding protein